MRFIYGKQDFRSRERGRENCYLLTNGLGGFSSLSITGEAARNDHALLMACLHAPNQRRNLIHRLEEVLTTDRGPTHLSTQTFPKGGEDGWKNLNRVTVEDLLVWEYQTWGVFVTKTLAMKGNAVALRYQLNNLNPHSARLTVTPWMQFTPKGTDLKPEQAFSFRDGKITSAGITLHLATNGSVETFPTAHQALFYACDRPDGRRDTGLAAANHRISVSVPGSGSAVLELLWSCEAPTETVPRILAWAGEHRRALEEQSGLQDPLARQLAVSADAFIAWRESTGSKTILAGYPFFEDWGRDTMIALPGCALSTRRYDDAKSILTTFMAYERKGLMPNLFPEGKTEPMYNTADAALQFISCVYLYFRRTRDLNFAAQAFPVMERIVSNYRRGTDYGIRMEDDGLIRAGEGLWQVTWMDVRVDDILPTPRHGKPVELNACWYNAMKIMDFFCVLLSKPRGDYEALAQQIRASFRKQFWHPKGYLRDVISGTSADDQIRCNQIWAVTMPFTMLEPDQARQVVSTVACHLYTPVGLRTLSPEDKQFHPDYGGPQKVRDLAYHQGTVWPFPLGAFYLAWLKVHDYSQEAKDQVRLWLQSLIPALQEGCAGQIPEIYDGENPTASRGCFAQAWSVGELLRVLEALERSDAESEQM